MRYILIQWWQGFKVSIYWYCLFEVDIGSVHMVVTRTAGTDRQIDSSLIYGNWRTEAST